MGEALCHYAMFRTLSNEELGVEPSFRFTRLLAERLPPRVAAGHHVP
ncbi:hypothetical protein [Streptomyces hydrogenans]